MFCTKCGNSIPQGGRFCPICGTPVPPSAAIFEEPVAPPPAPEPMPEPIPEPAEIPADVFEPFTEPEEEELPEPEVFPNFAETPKADEAPEKTKKPAKKWIIIGAAALAAIIIAVVLICVFCGGGKGSPLMLYRKDNELMGYNGDEAPFMISDDYSYECSASLDEEAAMLYYTDSPEYNGDYISCRLYYRDYENPQSRLPDADPEKGVLVSKNVSTYSGVGETLVYIKDEAEDGGKLRAYYKGEDISLDSGVEHFQLSKDGKKVVYFKIDGDDTDIYEVYLSDSENAYKVASGGRFLIDGDYETLKSYLFVKYNSDYDCNVYSYTEGSNPSKVISKISNFDYIDDELLLVKAESGGMDYAVIDDMPEDDEAANDLRRQAEEYGGGRYSVYKLDGGEPVLVAEHLSYDSFGGGNGLLLYGTEEANDKPKLSELIDDGYEYWEDVLYDYYYDDMSVTVRVGEMSSCSSYEALSFETDDELGSIDYNIEDGCLYWIEDYDGGEGRFMRAEVGASALGEAETIAKDVNAFDFGADGEVYYLKDNDDGEGTLYFYDGSESKKLADEVFDFTYRVASDGSSVELVWTDYDDGLATLSVFDGRELIKIDDDTQTYGLQFRGKELGLFYLRDYDSSSQQGELMCWTAKSGSKKIDDDVSEIVWIGW